MGSFSQVWPSPRKGFVTNISDGPGRHLGLRVKYWCEISTPPSAQAPAFRVAVALASSDRLQMPLYTIALQI